MLTSDSLKYLKHLKSTTVLNSIYLKRLYDYFEMHDYTYDEPKIHNVRSKIPDFDKYVAPNLKMKFKGYQNTTLVQWTVNSTFRIECSLYLHKKTKKINKKILNLLVYIISYTVSLSNKDRTFDIHVVLLPDKKKFLKKFSQNEINSGVASYTENSAEIFVYRKEECIKVLIHELIHGLSFSDINDNPDVITYYNNKYKLIFHTNK